MKVYACRTGAIEFGRYVPAGAIMVAKGKARQVRGLCEVLARHAYDGKTLLVPGIPEAQSNKEAGDALALFIAEVAKRNNQGGRHEHVCASPC